MRAYKANPPVQGTREGSDESGKKEPKRLAPATVNRDLALLKATFNRAMKSGKVDTNPVNAVKLYRENNARTRCLTDEEEPRLYGTLPDYLDVLRTPAGLSPKLQALVPYGKRRSPISGGTTRATQRPPG